MSEDIVQGIKSDENKKFFNEMGAAQTKVDFGIKDAFKASKDKNKIVSVGGDVLFKDINLFIPELIINIALLIFGVLGIILARLVSQNWLNVEYAKYVSPQALELAVGHVMFLQTVLMVGIAIPVLFSFGLFVFKWYFFYPRGKKQFVIRAWKANIARIGVEEVKDNYLKFDPSKDNSDEVHVNYGNAAIDYYTGRKMLLVEEGQPENTPLHRSVQTNEKVKDKGNVTSSIFSAAMKFIDYQNKKSQGFFSNPQNLILLLLVAGVGVVILFMMTNGSPTTAVQGAVAGLTARGA